MNKSASKFGGIRYQSHMIIFVIEIKKKKNSLMIFNICPMSMRARIYFSDLSLETWFSILLSKGYRSCLAFLSFVCLWIFKTVLFSSIMINQYKYVQDHSSYTYWYPITYSNYLMSYEQILKAKGLCFTPYL